MTDMYCVAEFWIHWNELWVQWNEWWVRWKALCTASLTTELWRSRAPNKRFRPQQSTLPCAFRTHVPPLPTPQRLTRRCLRSRSLCFFSLRRLTRCLSCAVCLACHAPQFFFFIVCCGVCRCGEGLCVCVCVCVCARARACVNICIYMDIHIYPCI